MSCEILSQQHSGNEEAQLSLTTRTMLVLASRRHSTVAQLIPVIYGGPKVTSANYFLLYFYYIY